MTKIPIIMCIDVEPDAHPVDLRPEKDWDGFLKAYQYFGRLRSRLERLTKSPVHFSWFLRIDPSMARIYGSPSWVVERYSGLIGELEAEGDEVGLHPHISRWNEASRFWFSDFGDQEWVNHCARTSFEAFQKSLGRTCRSCRFGDRWTNSATLNLVEEMGARFDLTIEPGIKAAGLGPAFVGAELDYSGISLHPYHPSRDDFRKAGANRPLWSIPLSTGKAEWGLATLDAPGIDRPSSDISRDSESVPRPCAAGTINPDYRGFLDQADCQTIAGWAHDLRQPDTVVNIDIYDGDTLLNTVPADCLRLDLFLAGKRNGRQAFFIKVPSWMKDGKPHSIRVRVAGTDRDLSGSPKTICCDGDVCPDESMTVILNRPSQVICKIIDALLRSRVPYLAMVLRSDHPASQAGQINLDLTFDYLLSQSHVLAERFVFETPERMIRRFEVTS